MIFYLFGGLTVHSLFGGRFGWEVLYVIGVWVESPIGWKQIGPIFDCERGVGLTVSALRWVGVIDQLHRGTTNWKERGIQICFS